VPFTSGLGGVLGLVIGLSILYNKILKQLQGKDKPMLVLLPYQVSLQALTSFLVLVGGSLLLLKLLRVL
jgi:hypothetical protein